MAVAWRGEGQVLVTGGRKWTSSSRCAVFRVGGEKGLLQEPPGDVEKVKKKKTFPAVQRTNPNIDIFWSTRRPV